MPFSNDDFTLKRNVPTTALKTTDDFRFSQLIETAKDAFVRELRAYFYVTNSISQEALNIDKYIIGQQSTDPTENMLTLIRQQPDILQKMPLVSITTASGRKMPVGLGHAHVAAVQYMPRLRASSAEPYDLSALLSPSNPPVLEFKTQPDGQTDLTSTMVFAQQFFPNPAAVTAQQIANGINFQALYANARAVTVGNDVYLELLAGGPIRQTVAHKVIFPFDSPQRKYHNGGPETPNLIEITSGSTPGLLTELGLSVGQSDDSNNPSRPPCNRVATAADLTIGLDVGATSDNERTEITDLLINFFNLYMDARRQTFYGEHVFNEPADGLTSERHFQITLRDWTLSGEADIPRPDGEREDKIYVNRFNIPVMIWDYVDRAIRPEDQLSSVGVDPELPEAN